MREIRYFGLNQWVELSEFLGTLQKRGTAGNIVVRAESKWLRYVVEWYEELIDLENK